MAVGGLHLRNPSFPCVKVWVCECVGVCVWVCVSMHVCICMYVRMSMCMCDAVGCRHQTLNFIPAGDQLSVYASECA